ncbi:MAG: hypothetical protein COW73_03980 [Nitrospirae bacterium CG18_big_fil_WC_8_21_14_2_50_70_55]|nr:hypothetical protein [Deltaproteobacteria bacterium]OIP64871.1 MAG: hypothetical protein AUK30_05960 [Nitrospirae bacterium CG2_30_70_394]PIQ06198.1 MAG: hypothetical protein COW73_03980 [Nitrospirae bacterium CG18_big_fil_WC_8_21_14_2_50_70_55]PIU80228.1 MAG: hypothetical protein COS73_00270 [Nitrospirae bacterium CG06_land_8_20_14_3_00_70_43]PIW83124.1 MAG: hypothetical protein COZ96_05120 [Nitrospirae bacterium CG_4_8_14_3_um_filter_70_85]PIX83970.1 MAG: hypothetical protein COZ33_02595 
MDAPTQLVRAVQRNCDIADARYAADHTLCIFLLKMREHFRWERGMGLTATLAKQEVGDWLSRREALWEQIEGDEFGPLPLPSGPCDPFAVAHANAALSPLGLVYGAGLGHRGRPTFFLAELARAEQREGFAIQVAGRELARDMAAPPAMLQGEQIFVRTDALRREVWSRIEEWQGQHRDGPLDRAMALFAAAGDGGPEALLERVTTAQVAAATLHEVGEGLAGRILGTGWLEMQAAIGCGRPELCLRAVRDLFADSLTTLPYLVATGAAAPLHLYFAHLRGLHRVLAGEWVAAYERFCATGDATPLAMAATVGATRWRATAESLLAAWPAGTAAVTAITETLVP